MLDKRVSVNSLTNLVRVDGDYVVILGCGAGWDYEIPKKDLMNHYFLCEWVRHMSQKNWVTKSHIEQLASVAQSLGAEKCK